MSDLRFVLPLVLASAAGAAGAALSADCQQALETLQGEEAALVAAPAGQSPESKRYEALRRLEPFRLRAATACLGGLPATPPPSQHTVQPPIAARPITVPAPMPRSVAPTPPPAPVIRPSAPTTISTCDPAGCTASDGSRLQRAGPNLIGPRGLCTVQGTLLICP